MNYKEEMFKVHSKIYLILIYIKVKEIVIKKGGNIQVINIITKEVNYG